MSKQTPPKIKTILFVRLPGLLAQSVHPGRTDTHTLYPLVVSESRLVRDACPLALAPRRSCRRKRCPGSSPLPDASGPCRWNRWIPVSGGGAFWDALADLSPVVEPDNLDTAYVDFTGDSSGSFAERVKDKLLATCGLSPVVGLGASRLAARACAESGVTSLENAAVDFLWPDDPAVAARMKRLGLSTFGQAAGGGAKKLCACTSAKSRRSCIGVPTART